VPYAAVPTKNPGDILTATLWNTYIQGNADAGFMRMLANVTLGSAAATIDFTSIPATFAHLRLVIVGRGDTAAGSTSLGLKVNNDAGGNYEWITLFGRSNSTLAYDTGVTTSPMIVGYLPAATAGGGLGISDILVADYASTVLHKGFTWTDKHFDATNRAAGAGGGRWTSTAAINRLTLLLGAGNFIAGSRATLYGLPA
jgi:hypothetical protein